MEKQLNEKIIRFVGSACIPLETAEIELGDDKKVIVEGNLVNVVEKDNQDGTRNREYVIKIITAEIK